jgi:phosphatidate phosphatase APP1
VTDDPLRTGRSEYRPGSQNPLAQVARPHIAARIEDAVDGWIAGLLVRRGWTVRIVPHVGIGGPGWVRVTARTVLAAPYYADSDLPESGDTSPTAPDDDHLADVRGWRSFLTAPVAGTRVRVTVGDRSHVLVADRAGYIDQVVPGDLPLGWQQIELRTGSGAGVHAPIQVVDSAARFGMVVDIDDTVMVTRLPRPLVAAWNSFVRRADAREAVPGMAELLNRLAATDPGMPVVYLSTGAWDTTPTIVRFLRVNGFPTGTLLMTDWGPTNTGWFRSGPRHKVTQLRRLFTRYPSIQWYLIGDDGQHDPMIYAGAVRHHGPQVAAVLLRQLTFAEHVLASGSALGPDLPTHRRVAPRPVPVLAAPDGYALLRAAHRAGLVPKD